MSETSGNPGDTGNKFEIPSGNTGNPWNLIAHPIN